ncbi:hypothetical protein HQO44_12590 [Rhodococcus fascians]|uniref:hypothetical protein n=1 Tax=Rhodococcoides fascians TaxID=1828 RepID=UPI00195CD559|nr:hypothetical protein [Rhodococcus fascians]MBY4207300.1 hypothetical protein [Rhodococcus fascians]MDJ0408100.1 hypothetical protein [Rhodococcus fascians]
MAFGSVSGLVRRLPEAVGLARAAIGIAHMVAPTRANELLAGPDAAVATTRAAARTFGIREIYIGGGLYAATRYAPKAVRTLLRAGVAVDVWDTAAFALTAHLPQRTRTAGCAIAGGFVIAGALADLQLDR